MDATAKIGWARPAGKWHIFSDDVSNFTGERVSVCRATGLGRIQTLLNAPSTDRVCRKCIQWNKERQR